MSALNWQSIANKNITQVFARGPSGQSIQLWGWAKLKACKPCTKTINVNDVETDEWIWAVCVLKVYISQPIVLQRIMVRSGVLQGTARTSSQFCSWSCILKIILKDVDVGLLWSLSLLLKNTLPLYTVRQLAISSSNGKTHPRLEEWSKDPLWRNTIYHYQKCESLGTSP